MITVEQLWDELQAEQRRVIELEARLAATIVNDRVAGAGLFALGEAMGEAAARFGQQRLPFGRQKGGRR